METIVAAILAAMAAAVITGAIQELRARSRISDVQQQNHDAEMQRTRTIATLEAQLREHQSIETIIAQAKEQMGDHFHSAASRALQTSSEQFLTLAEQNMGKTLEIARGEIQLRHDQFQAMVRPLTENYNRLDPRLEQLLNHSTQVATAADRLTNALNDNRQLGSWGEIQLRRIIELAGMTEYCDFSEQRTGTGQERPDLTVHLPEHRTIVIDAKASTKAYLEAQETADTQEASLALSKHAAAMKTQVDDLATKQYGQKVKGSLDFVIMFVPGDQFLSAALTANPELIEYAIAKRVAIATPSSLISLLWAVANGWQRHRMAQEAESLLEIGQEMHKRLQTFIGHYETAGRRLTAAMDAYNASIQSFDARVMPQARRFSTIIAKDEESLQPPMPIEKVVNTSRHAAQLQEPGG